MYQFLEQTQLNKTFKRFNKIRAYHNYGYNNLLPIGVLKKYSKNYQQIQFNTNFHFNAIIMDIDNPNLIAEWDIVGLPVPTIQTLNKNNNKGHLIWLLNTPVYKEHKHALDYYKAIVHNIKELIGADKAYQNHQTKNFLNTKLYRVTYNDIAYDLGDFRKFISKDTPIDKEYQEFDYMVADSRHIHLFELLRRYGYKIASEPNLKERLVKKAEEINLRFNEPIKTKYIINSVYSFCEKNRNNFRQNQKKVMKFEKIRNLSPLEYKEEVKQRQSKAAKRTIAIKKHKTVTKIKVAIDRLIREREPLNVKNLANYAKVSVSTIRRNQKIVNFFIINTSGFIRSIRLIVQRAELVCTEYGMQFYWYSIKKEFNTIHKLE
jgi:hypothetical protein